MFNSGTKSGPSCLPNSPAPLPGREKVGACDSGAGFAADAEGGLCVKGSPGEAIDTLLVVRATEHIAPRLGKPGLAMLDRITECCRSNTYGLVDDLLPLRLNELSDVTWSELAAAAAGPLTSMPCTP